MVDFTAFSLRHAKRNPGTCRLRGAWAQRMGRCLGKNEVLVTERFYKKYRKKKRAPVINRTISVSIENTIKVLDFQAFWLGFSSKVTFIILVLRRNFGSLRSCIAKTSKCLFLFTESKQAAIDQFLFCCSCRNDPGSF